MIEVSASGKSVDIFASKKGSRMATKPMAEKPMSKKTLAASLRV